MTVNTEAIMAEIEALSVDKRKGRAYLDHSLRATLKALEARERELGDFRNYNAVLKDANRVLRYDRNWGAVLLLASGIVNIGFLLSVLK